MGLPSVHRVYAVSQAFPHLPLMLQCTLTTRCIDRPTISTVGCLPSLATSCAVTRPQVLSA